MRSGHGKGLTVRLGAFEGTLARTKQEKKIVSRGRGLQIIE
jgi:hypothetical protein